jgi:hypothetical protein
MVKVKTIVFVVSAMLMFALGPPHSTSFGEEKGDEKLSALLDRVAGAYGGLEALGRVRSVYARGRTTAFMRGDVGTYVRYMQRDGRLRVDITYTVFSERRILDGEKGMRGPGGSPLVEVTGARYGAMLYQYRSLDLPHGLLSGAYKVRREGREELGGVPVEVLGLEGGKGSPMKAYIDAEKGFVLKTTGFFTVNGRTTSLSAEFSDFRAVDGTFMPFRVANYAGGTRIGETTIEEYRINPRFGDAVWRGDDLPE